MIIYIHSDCDSAAFKNLIKELDDELYARYGEAQDAYKDFNNVEGIDHAIVATDGHNEIACGCFKKYSGDISELKRIYVKKEYRGKRIAQRLVSNAENWAKSLGYKKMILQTGSKQPEAVRLYEKLGYNHIENYGHYVGDDNSVCFEKEL